MATTDILVTLDRTTKSLDAILYHTSEPANETRHGVQRYIFVTEPPDLALWRPGDDINLVCLTDNKAQTFWSVVAEKRNDDAFADRTRAWARAPHLAEAFSRLIIEELPGGGSLTLQHAPMPANFDIMLVDAYGIPDYAASSSVSVHAKQRLSSVRSALSARKCISAKTIATYDTIREWMQAAGLFSKDLGPVNARILLDMILSIDVTTDGVAEFLRLYVVPSCVTSAIKTYPSTFFKSDQAWISQEVSRLGHDKRLLSVTHASQSVRFRKDYSQFIQLQSRTWTSRGHGKAWDRLTAILTPLRAELAQYVQIKLRVWPTLFNIGTTAENEQYAALLVGVDTQSKADLQQLSRAMETFTYKHTSKLEGDDFLLSIDLQPQSVVHGYTPIDFAPRSPRPTAEVSLKGSPERSDTGAQEVNKKKEKFRTAAQTLSRLRWDPGHKVEKYEVGYLDRFDGLIWLPLDAWGKAVEEEDFIPEHRIQQFRRLDKTIVWDRAKKIDLTGQVV